MRRQLAWVLAALVVLAAAGAGVGAWRLARAHSSALPQISAYSHGTTVRVGPYLYCNVVDLNDCAKNAVQGQLPVTERFPVQLSLPPAISSAPWRLLRVYSDERDTTETSFRPGQQFAVKVPTVDPQRGKLLGVVVQLMTLVQDQNGELHDLPHAEWSVRLAWN